MVFQLVMYGCESWTIKKAECWRIWCLQIVVLEKSPESSLDSMEIKPVNLKGDQPWILFGRTDAETPLFWSSDVNRWLIGKVPDADKDWEQKEKRASENEMTGWHHQCNGHEFRQTGRWWGTGRPGVLQSMESKSQTWLGNWTTIPLRWMVHNSLSTHVNFLSSSFLPFKAHTTLLYLPP